jgi:hypothetical protein
VRERVQRLPGGVDVALPPPLDVELHVRPGTAVATSPTTCTCCCCCCCCGGGWGAGLALLGGRIPARGSQVSRQ